jgi:hypothetical protein
MDYKILAQILMKWALENQEWKMVYYLYTELNVGIPGKYLYKIEDKKTFTSIDNFLNHSSDIYCLNIFFQELAKLFKKSKWSKLIEWSDTYGYRLKSN